MQAPREQRYPIGKFQSPEVVTATQRDIAIVTLTEFPERFHEAVQDLSEEQLETPYREGGWMLRQLVHHVADSHATALFRVKKALTEDWPTLPGYPEADFAKLADSAAPIRGSLDLIAGVHARWVILLCAMNEEQWKRGYMHAERGPQALELVTVHYAWHSLHHLAHITCLRAEKGW